MKHPVTRRARTFAVGVAAAAAASLALAGSALADTGPVFAIGDQNTLAVGTQVEFWGAQWWMDNPLSTGFAPASFKGYVVNPPAGCGGTWTTDPGNSGQPPATLPGTVEAVVSTTITQSGSVISGDTKAIAEVSVDPGYAGDPGHPGTGTIVGFVCGGPTPTGGTIN
jgi:hypothetical protein